MKKLLLVIFFAVLLIGCGSHISNTSVELSTQYLLDRYDTETLSLDLSDQGFVSFPDIEPYMTSALTYQIYKIDLSGNKLQKIPPRVFDIYPNLNTLDLSDNDFKFGSDIVLSDSVIRLSVHNNILDDITGFGAYKNLRELDIRYNSLDDNDLSELGGLDNLQKLYVEGNPVSDELYQKIERINNTSVKKQVR